MSSARRWRSSLALRSLGGRIRAAGLYLTAWEAAEKVRNTLRGRIMISLHQANGEGRPILFIGSSRIGDAVLGSGVLARLV